MKTTFHRLDLLLDAFRDPEYRFLVLEPILSYGIALGVFVFVVSFLLKAEKIQMAGLVLGGLSALVFLPYIAARKAALPRIQQIYQFSLAKRGERFTENTVAWSASTWLYIALVVLCAATLLIGSRRNQLGYALSIGTVLLGLFAVQNSLWLHYQDATAVHPNLSSHQTPIEGLTRGNGVSSSRTVTPSVPRESVFTAPYPENETPKPRLIRPIH